MASLGALVRALRSIPPRQLVRATARYPLELATHRLLEQLPSVELTDLCGTTPFQAAFLAPSTRHAWSLGASEQLVLQAIVAGRHVSSAFEIGTFNGGTTLLLAGAVPGDGIVVTLDLPPTAFDSSQSPEGFSGSAVGAAYRGTAVEGKISQLLADSLSFDPTPYEGKFDLVLVDGGHEYEHGVADTRTALRLVAPGGIILWDDFQPYWHGLVRGICQEMTGRRLARLAGTAMGVYVHPG